MKAVFPIFILLTLFAGCTKRTASENANTAADSSSHPREILDFTPVENVQVLLYDTHFDSIVAKEKPYYSTKTDKSGSFTFKNIKAKGPDGITRDLGAVVLEIN